MQYLGGLLKEANYDFHIDSSTLAMGGGADPVKRPVVVRDVRGSGGGESVRAEEGRSNPIDACA